MRDLLAYWKSPRKRVLLGGLSVSLFLVALLGAAAFFVLQKGKDIEVELVPTGTVQEEGSALSSLRGEPCLNGAKRPYAIMLAEDTVARPLSGISYADVVVEMPVMTRGINRMMALFQCAHPSEIGSVRSARHDFLPLAAGFDAILGHWGGSHLALEELQGGVLDNIDALPNPFSAYYRKSGVAAPHNGFTSFDLLLRAARGLGYRTESTTFAGYERKAKEPLDTKGIVRIQYPSPVSYEYEASSGKYLRFRGNLREKDALNQKQASADVIAVVFAASYQVEPEYNDIDLASGGKLIIFEDGRRIDGTWRKAPESTVSKLEFLDVAGNPIPLVPGTLFIQVVEPGTVVTYP